MTSRGGRRQEHRELARALRAEGREWPDIAAVLRERYGLPARVAMRVAHDWSQADAAAAWNTRWPDDPKSFKNISYWETWPSPTGHAPSLAVLDRLARVYECDVADLVAGWGEHRAGADRAQRLPEPQRPDPLLGPSSATAPAAGRSGTADGPAPSELVGRWDSHRTCAGTERETTHRFDLRLDGSRLVGRSEPTAAGSLELDLRADGRLVTGSWTGRTAPDGHSPGAAHHGVVQLAVAPDGREMVGRWLGPDEDLAIGTGTWTLTRV